MARTGLTTSGSTAVDTVLRRGPALVLVARADEGSDSPITAVLAAHADRIDLRHDVAWVEVADVERLLLALADAVPPSERHGVRLGFAPIGADPDTLVAAALAATSLADAVPVAEVPTPRFDVAFQPIVDLRDGGPIGFEALLRASLEGTPLDTAELVERAEHGGWLEEFDRTARTLAVRRVGPWLGDRLLFLNIRTVADGVDLEAVRDLVAMAGDRGLEPDQLVLELSERDRIVDYQALASQVEDLHRLGVRVALDDLGEGHAGLRALTVLRPTVVKIGASIVSELPSASARAVVGAVVRLAADTGSWVVAEGIETADQVAALVELGVPWGQGHHLGRPVVTA